MTKRFQRRAGLGLQQWVLIVGIIVVLVVIGLPLTARTKKENARERMTEDVMRVVAAREHYGVEHGLNKGTSVTLEQILMDGKHLKEVPVSLRGHEIRLGGIGGRVAYQLGEGQGEWVDPLPTKEKPSPKPDQF